MAGENGGWIFFLQGPAAFRQARPAVGLKISCRLRSLVVRGTEMIVDVVLSFFQARGLNFRSWLAKET